MLRRAAAAAMLSPPPPRGGPPRCASLTSLHSGLSPHGVSPLSLQQAVGSRPPTPLATPSKASGSRPATPLTTPSHAERRVALAPLFAPLPHDFSTASELLAGSPARALRRSKSAAALKRQDTLGRLLMEPLPFNTVPAKKTLALEPLPQLPGSMPPSPAGVPRADAGMLPDGQEAITRAQEALDAAVIAGLGEDVNALKARARQALQQALQITAVAPNGGGPALMNITEEDLRQAKRKARDALHFFVGEAVDKGRIEVAASAEGGQRDSVGEAPAAEDVLTEEELEEAKRRARAALDAVLVVETDVFYKSSGGA